MSDLLTFDHWETATNHYGETDAAILAGVGTVELGSIGLWWAFVNDDDNGRVFHSMVEAQAHLYRLAGHKVYGVPNV